MFIFRAATFLDELRRHRPDIASATEAAWTTGKELPHGRLAGAEAWATCPSESLDYAVAEKTDRAAVVPASMGWSDVGSWSSLMNLAQRDDRGNALFGTVWTIDSNGCYVRSTSRNVAVIGAQDIIVIETADAVLIVHKDATQQVKHAAAQFAALSGLPDAAE
jgi:mannose-1-phosphate guanylyltransferase/mannose-1-phosphate guanylyltransferase/mannose-6-phosphate isomerase